MVAEFRDMKDKLVLHTNVVAIERRLKRVNSYIYSMPYYNSNNGRIVGIDLYFERSARRMLLKIANTYQLPLF